MGAEVDHPSVIAARRRAEPEIAWRHVPRLDPREYNAYCRAAKIYRDRGFNRWVCAVQFDVLDENLNKRASLTWFLNLGSGDKPKVTRRSNYWAAWIKANGGPPQRWDRMSPRVFTRRYVTVIVGDTTRDSRRDLATNDFAYSVIRAVASWDTGGQKQPVTIQSSGSGLRNIELKKSVRSAASEAREVESTGKTHCRAARKLGPSRGQG